MSSEGEPPKIDTKKVLAYQKNLTKILAHGDSGEKKKHIRNIVDEIKVTPDTYEVDITYKVPEPFMNRQVAGAGFEPATSGL